jgi:predicted GNAT family acetyltransferase
VYTVERLRNRGIGEYLLAALLDRIYALGKRASLFVKKDNPAAIQLYRKLGFLIRSEFRIAYYR